MEFTTYRSWQIEAVRAIVAEFVVSLGCLIVAPTGCGKTALICLLCEMMGIARDAVTFICPDKATKDNAIEYSFNAYTPTDFLKKFMSGKAWLPTLFVFDEAHHYAADEWNNIIEIARATGTKYVGLTATPKRADGLSVASALKVNGPCYRLDVHNAISEGWIVPPQALCIKTRVRGVDSPIDQMRSIRLALIEAADALKSHKSIIYVQSVGEIATAVEILTACGLRCAGISSKNSAKVRTEVLKAFGAGELEAVVAYNMLTEGFDEAAIDTIAIMRTMTNERLYAQMIGRGLRAYPGKESCTVIAPFFEPDYKSNVTLLQVETEVSSYL